MREEQRPTTDDGGLTGSAGASSDRAVAPAGRAVADATGTPPIEPAWLTAIAERKRPFGVPVSVTQGERDMLVRIARAAYRVAYLGDGAQELFPAFEAER